MIRVFNSVQIAILIICWNKLFPFAEPDIYKEVKQKLELGSVKFEVPRVMSFTPENSVLFSSIFLLINT